MALLHFCHYWWIGSGKLLTGEKGNQSMHQLSYYSIFNVKLLPKIKIPSPFFLSNSDNSVGLPKPRKKQKVLSVCITNYGILLLENGISSNNYPNFYTEKNLDEFKYQDSSYICSTALDIPFYFCTCVGVNMQVLHSGSNTNWAHEGWDTQEHQELKLPTLVVSFSAWQKKM